MGNFSLFFSWGGAHPEVLLYSAQDHIQGMCLSHCSNSPTPNGYSFFFGLYFGDAHRLLLALHSPITPAGALEPICGAGDQICKLSARQVPYTLDHFSSPSNPHFRDRHVEVRQSPLEPHLPTILLQCHCLTQPPSPRDGRAKGDGVLEKWGSRKIGPMLPTPLCPLSAGVWRWSRAGRPRRTGPPCSGQMSGWGGGTVSA